MAKRTPKTKSLDNYVTENVDVIQNKLLGDYNSDGEYTIEQRITNELVKLKKKEKESYNSDIFCTAKTAKGDVIDFKISIKSNPKNKQDIAVLEVLEGVAKQGGKSVNIIQTTIAKYVDKDTKDFRDKALQYYNVETESNKGRDVKEIDEDNINSRKDFLAKLDEVSYNEINKAYKEYYNARVKTLKRGQNTYSKDLLDMLRNDISDPVTAMFFKDKKYKLGFNYKAMNEVLDNAVEYYSTCPQYSGDQKVFEDKTKSPLEKLKETIENYTGISGKYIDNFFHLFGVNIDSPSGIKFAREIDDFTNNGINQNGQIVIKYEAGKIDSTTFDSFLGAVHDSSKGKTSVGTQTDKQSYSDLFFKNNDGAFLGENCGLAGTRVQGPLSQYPVDGIESQFPVGDVKVTPEKRGTARKSSQYSNTSITTSNIVYMSGHGQSTSTISTQTDFESADKTYSGDPSASTEHHTTSAPKTTFSPKFGNGISTSSTVSTMGGYSTMQENTTSEPWKYGIEDMGSTMQETTTSGSRLFDNDINIPNNIKESSNGSMKPPINGSLAAAIDPVRYQLIYKDAVKEVNSKDAYLIDVVDRATQHDLRIKMERIKGDTGMTMRRG